ncbi:hypothetical protein HGRIS_007164 [Hohenbuehelia grisea]|uniref:MICOS complex subunit n=1 Tax=Hohenbuehelia grisea TaxID=104357 RepID=A0ABR3JB81_9AGAR
MFRAALRPRRVAAFAAATGVVLHTPPQDQDKLPIYPLPTPEILLVETHSPLEQQIGVARQAVTQAYNDAYSQVQGVVSKWIGVEHAIENRVKSIIAPDEPLTPGLLYVGISTLTGSILARNRFLPTRLILPPAFFFASLSHFLPRTSANLTGYFSSLEETYFPTVADKHAIANAHSRMAWERVKEATQNGRESFSSGVEIAVDKIQETTGLKLKETLGWGQATERRLVALKDEATKALEHKLDDVKAEVKEQEKKLV